MASSNYDIQKTYADHESRNVSQIRYDPATQAMQVDFRSGGTYEYHNVPEETWVAALSAPSIGSFIHATIKNRFQFRKI